MASAMPKLPARCRPGGGWTSRERSEAEFASLKHFWAGAAARVCYSLVLFKSPHRFVLRN
jgi:hypothetical protein